MISVKISQLFGYSEGFSNPELMIESVTSDSRKVERNSLFVAIKGDKHDGNDFVKDAMEKGAVAAIVNRRTELPIEQIVVPDSRYEYIRAAGNYRDMFDVDIVGVTGSVGKTTTKDMTHSALSVFGPSLKTLGNKNNEIGLPETLFNLDGTQKTAVIEMAMDNLGDISRLTRVVKPRVAIITAIGVSHIEHLGSRENILRAKLEIMEGLREGGTAVINADDDMLSPARASLNCKCVTFSIKNPDGDVRALDPITRDYCTEFTIVDREAGSFFTRIPCIGDHNVLDALAAYCAVTRMGFNPQRTAEGLLNYEPSGMRQKIVDFRGATIIEDCYNASPDSMNAALRTLAHLPIKGRRIAVLGDMLELGVISDSAHKQLGMEAAKQGIDVLLCYGDKTLFTAETAKAAGVVSVEHFSDKVSAGEYLSKTVHSGDAVLFKASRGMELEDVISILYASEERE